MRTQKESRFRHTFKGVRSLINKYAKANEFQVIWDSEDPEIKGQQDGAMIIGRTIHFTPNFSSPGRLALAFCHEVGHLATDTMPNEIRKTRVEDEIAAWSLAHKYHRKIFKCNPCKSDEKFITDCLDSYTN